MIKIEYNSYKYLYTLYDIKFDLLFDNLFFCQSSNINYTLS